MKLQDFIDKGEVRRVRIDRQLIRAFIMTTENDLKFLGRTPIDKLSARKQMANYYDALRTILEAIAANKGYKSYSHEALTYFLSELGDDDDAKKFEKYRRLRNGINYYGKDITPEEVVEHREDIVRLIDRLKRKYLKEQP